MKLSLIDSNVQYRSLLTFDDNFRSTPKGDQTTYLTELK